MNFYQEQDRARRQTRWMIFMFLVSVVLVVCAVDAIAYGILETLNSPPQNTPAWEHVPAYDATDYTLVLLATTGITLLVITIASWSKISTLASGGGEYVALAMGGRLVDPSTTDFKERRLLNVVQEMAIASGIPVPPVYVMDEEGSINAFAAGDSPDKAVVAVTRGTIEILNRDELQGGIAHEFSHILNGDMRLNIRMIGLLCGIYAITMIGMFVLRAMIYSRGGDDKKSGGKLVLLAVGLALVVIGCVGWFCGQLIQAAISRQREYLADASAVQFTRNPAGIGNALVKIGGIVAAERAIHASAAGEAAHLFFSNALGVWSFGLMATHPPLERRIQKLLPGFDGTFPEVSSTESVEESKEPKQGTAPLRQLGILAGLLAALDDDSMKRATQEIYSAQAVIFAVLLDREHPDVEARQRETLQGAIEEPLFQEMEKLLPKIRELSPAQMYPLVDLTVRTLTQLSPQQYQTFRHNVIELINADGKVDLREYILYAKTIRSLDLRFGLRQSESPRYRKWREPLISHAVRVLSRLAYSGSDDPEAIQSAFQKATAELGWKDVSLMPMEECGIRNLNESLEELSHIASTLKQPFLQACDVCVAADGQLTDDEISLLSGISAMLR